VRHGPGSTTGLLGLDDRAWAVTDHQDTAALNFLRCRGRRQTVYPPPRAQSARIVLLTPRHPALSEIQWPP
jgi:hypothetical protein